jgi:hypothetical protein
LPFRASETLPATVVAIANGCIARFPVATVEFRSLPVLLSLASTAGDTSAIAAVITRQLSAATSPRARAKVIIDALSELRHDTPELLALSARYVQLADSAWPNAFLERAGIHMGVASYLWSRQYNADAATQELATVRQLLQRVNADSMTEGERDFARLLTYVSQSIPWYGAVFRLGVTDSLVEALRAISGGKYGEVIPQLHGEFWYPDSAADSIYPVPGRPTVVAFIDLKSQHLAVSLRRLHRKFPTLPIVLAAATTGRFRNRPPPSTAQEAEWIRDYVRNELHLPFSLVVDTVPHRKLPDPDRRQLSGVTSAVVQLRSRSVEDLYGGMAYILDRKGRIILMSNGYGDSRLIDLVIEKMVEP